MVRLGRIHSFAVIAALVAMVGLPATASAVVWHQTRNLSTAPGAVVGNQTTLAKTGPTSAIAIFGDRTTGTSGDRVFVRRTTDSGSSWSTALAISGVPEEAASPSIAARGLNVHATWSEGTRTVYRRSLDGGVTWQPPINLSQVGGESFAPSVAADPAGHVIVAWAEWATGKIKARWSSNGGASFGVQKMLGTTVDIDGIAVAAYGTGVTYVAFYSAADIVQVRRSSDWGANWDAPITLTIDGQSNQSLGITARSSKAIVGFNSGGALVTRATFDSGLTWSGEAIVGAPAFGGTRLSLAGGKWRIVYGDLIGGGQIAIWHQETTDPEVWDDLSQVYDGATLAGAGNAIVFGNRVVVCYTYDADTSANIRARARVRLGS